MATDDPQYKCEFCSRRAYQGHHPDCANNPANQVSKTVEVPRERLDALRSIYEQIPDEMAVLQPLRDQMQALFDLTALVTGSEVRLTVRDAMVEATEQLSDQSDDELHDDTDEGLIDEDPAPTGESDPAKAE